MAIQLPNPGLGDGQTGDNEFVMWTKVKDNFSNTTHAASRLVGKSTGNLTEVGAFGIGRKALTSEIISGDATKPTAYSQTGLTSSIVYRDQIGLGFTPGVASAINVFHQTVSDGFQPTGRILLEQGNLYIQGVDNVTKEFKSPSTIYTTANVTKDGNGFLKGASPVVDLYDDHIELNQDAERQGGITFEKLGTGDYIVKGSLGFAQEGWYIETPKDANGNVLVAVVYEQLENNDISIKTYDYMLNKKGRIVPDTETPLDIPEGRCINLRLHEVKEQLDESIE